MRLMGNRHSLLDKDSNYRKTLNQKEKAKPWPRFFFAPIFSIIRNSSL